MTSTPLSIEEADKLREQLRDRLNEDSAATDAIALGKAIEAGTVANANLTFIKEMLRIAYEMLRSMSKPQEMKTKNVEGDVVTSTDLVIQSFIAEQLKRVHPSFHLVGEEDTPESCASLFPEPISDSHDIITIDPIDGSKVYRTGSLDFSIVIGYQRGKKPIFGVALMGLTGDLIVGGVYLGTTINGKRVKPPKAYDPGNVSIACGFGNLVSEGEKTSLKKALNEIASSHNVTREGHLTKSCALLLQHRKDAYISLKEDPTKYCATYAYMTKAGYVTNIDPAKIDHNKPVRAWFATPDFAEKHLQESSELAKFFAEPQK